MINYSDLEKAVDDINSKFPRPGLKLKLEPIESIDTPIQWQNAEQSGIYALFSKNGELLYIGKASMGSSIGYRIGAKFSSRNPRKAKEEKFSECTHMATIALPEERAFEAPSIEEYLIKSLKPRLNNIGK